MLNTYTETQAREILAQFRRHAQAEGVYYVEGPELAKPSVIVPLINDHWIEAAIITASDALKDDLQHPENRIQPSDVCDRSESIKVYMNRELPPGINEFQRGRIAECHKYVSAAGHDDDDIVAFIFAHYPNGNICFQPRLHVDEGINAYTASFGAPMEFCTASVPNGLKNDLTYFSDDQTRPLMFERYGVSPDVENELDGINIGDLIVWGDRFFHRSARRVINSATHQGEGLVAFSLGPS